MRNILNNILSILGYKIKRSKWLYENDKNLIATLKSQNINSIIDVGASSGQFAEQVFKNGFKGSIYSFEPLQKEHTILLIKSKKKKNSNWKIQKRCALGAADKDVVINISGRRQSSSIYNISKIHTSLFPDSKNISSETVKMEKLDNYLEEFSSLKKKILLKIDTQGYELEVIKGAKKIMPYIDCLLLEVSLTRLYEEQPLFEEILDYTSKNGFSIWSVDRVVGNKFTGQTHQLDVVFIK